MEANKVVLAKPSMASLLLIVKAKGERIGTATGFLVRKSKSVLLVTNRHVLRGRNNNTDEPLSKTGAIPDELEIYHNKKGSVGQWTCLTELLYDNNETPIWLEHPELKGKADVVVLPLTSTEGIEVFDYDPSNPGQPIKFGPTQIVSIVGFPFGRTAGGCLAIWVSGWVATEPMVNHDDLPQFLIDSRTRQGQSGSPVILYRDGGLVALEGGNNSVFNVPVTRFVGVYSGRINKDSDLGVVWKVEALEAIVDRGVKGSA